MMKEKDILALARQFMGNAVNVASGDNVWIEYVGDEAKPLAQACMQEAVNAGGKGFMYNSSGVQIAAILKAAGDSDDALEKEGARRYELMKTMNGYIRICDENDVNLAGIPLDDMRRYQGLVMEKATNHRVRYTNWLVVDSPSKAFAKACGMSLKKFEEFYLKVCLVDYNRMTEAGLPLEYYMAQAEHVRLTGEGTDISFIKKDISARLCTGKRNIPDGECFTAPDADSVNGYITYGPSRYWGKSFPWIRLEVRDGVIVKAESATDEMTVQLNTILDTDEGARRFGEFAIAFNPQIKKPTGNILFDEKIDGSIHLTPGQCYEDIANNGNMSKVHWDMVKIQRPDYGGGDIIMDDRLVRRNGIFMPKDLHGLNPQNLLR